MSEVEAKVFRENVDAWIKEINSDVSTLKEVPKILGDNIDNCQHNYELIHEMREEMDSLRQEIKMLKLMQTAILETKIEKVNQN